jgi:hypothetical protein
MQNHEGWGLVKLPEHENTQLVAVYHDVLGNELPTGRHDLASRRYVERQLVYSTWVEVATSKVVYANSLDAHIALMRERELLGNHKLIGLGKYALKHFSYFA